MRSETFTSNEGVCFFNRDAVRRRSFRMYRFSNLSVVGEVYLGRPDFGLQAGILFLGKFWDASRTLLNDLEELPVLAGENTCLYLI